MRNVCVCVCVLCNMDWLPGNLYTEDSNGSRFDNSVIVQYTLIFLCGLRHGKEVNNKWIIWAYAYLGHRPNVRHHFCSIFGVAVNWMERLRFSLVAGSFNTTTAAAATVGHNNDNTMNNNRCRIYVMFPYKHVSASLMTHCLHVYGWTVMLWETPASTRPIHYIHPDAHVPFVH